MKIVQQKVDIYSMSDILLASGMMVDLDKNYMEIVGKPMPQFVSGENVKVCAYDDMKGICWYFAVVDYASPDRLILTDYNLLDVIQRRRNIKIKVTFTTSIYAVYDSEGQKVTLDTPVKITVKDISIGGILFQCEEDFEEDSVFEFYFNQCAKHLRIKTRILRKTELSNDLLGYGCAFESVTEKEQDMLFAFLWEQQRLQQKRLKLD